MDSSNAQQETKIDMKLEHENAKCCLELGAKPKCCPDLKQEPEHKRDLSQPFPFAGVVATVASSLFFSCALLCVKTFAISLQNRPSAYSNAIQNMLDKSKIVGWRGCIITSICILYAAGTRNRGAPAERSFTSRMLDNIKELIMFRSLEEFVMVSLRSLFALGSIAGAYLALEYISMGDATALIFSSPIWTSIMGHFILKEKISLAQIILMPVCIFGIIMIAHPALIVDIHQAAGDADRQPLLPADLLTNETQLISFVIESDGSPLPPAYDLDAATDVAEPYDLEHRWPGIVISIATSFSVSAFYVIYKVGPQDISVQKSTFYLGIFTIGFAVIIKLLISGPGAYASGFVDLISLTKLELCLALGNGLLSWLAQSMSQWALLYEDASVLSIIRTLDVAFTYTLSALFMREQILCTSLLGAIIISVAVISIVTIKAMSRNRNAEK